MSKYLSTLVCFTFCEQIIIMSDYFIHIQLYRCKTHSHASQRNVIQY